MNKKTKKLVGLFILLVLLVVGTFFINTKEHVKEVIVEKQNQPERTVPVKSESSFGPQSWDTYGQYHYWTCAYSKDSIKTKSEYLYKNETYGFTLNIPSKWFVPTLEDSSSLHFYNCDKDNRTGSSFEIQGMYSGDYFKALLEEAQQDLANPGVKIYKDVIPNAVIIKHFSAITDGDGWVNWYSIIFEKEGRAFRFGTNWEIEENSIVISTFRLIK